MDRYDPEKTRPVLASPKLDGVHARATSVGVFTKNGQKLQVPHIEKRLRRYFRKHPDGELKGELWRKGAGVERIAGDARSGNTAGLRLHTYPGQAGRPLPFGAVRRVKGYKVQDDAGVQKVFRKSLRKGHEGVVVRDAAGVETKLKPQQDREWEVSGQRSAGSGKKTVLTLKHDDGSAFKVQAGSGAVAAKPGDRVQVRYSGVTRTGKPRAAVAVRVRNDHDFSMKTMKMRLKEFATRRGFLKGLMGAVAAGKNPEMLKNAVESAPKVLTRPKFNVRSFPVSGEWEYVRGVLPERAGRSAKSILGVLGGEDRVKGVSNGLAKRRVQSMLPKGGVSREEFQKRVKRTAAMLAKRESNYYRQRKNAAESVWEKAKPFIVGRGVRVARESGGIVTAVDNEIRSSLARAANKRFPEVDSFGARWDGVKKNRWNGAAKRMPKRVIGGSDDVDLLNRRPGGEYWFSERDDEQLRKDRRTLAKGAAMALAGGLAGYAILRKGSGGVVRDLPVHARPVSAGLPAPAPVVHRAPSGAGFKEVKTPKVIRVGQHGVVRGSQVLGPSLPKNRVVTGRKTLGPDLPSPVKHTAAENLARKGGAPRLVRAIEIREKRAWAALKKPGARVAKLGKADRETFLKLDAAARRWPTLRTPPPGTVTAGELRAADRGAHWRARQARQQARQELLAFRKKKNFSTPFMKHFSDSTRSDKIRNAAVAGGALASGGAAIYSARKLGRAADAARQTADAAKAVVPRFTPQEVAHAIGAEVQAKTKKTLKSYFPTFIKGGKKVSAIMKKKVFATPASRLIEFGGISIGTAKKSFKGLLGKAEIVRPDGFLAQSFYMPKKTRKALRVVIGEQRGILGGPIRSHSVVIPRAEPSLRREIELMPGVPSLMKDPVIVGLHESGHAADHLVGRAHRSMLAGRRKLMGQMRSGDLTGADRTGTKIARVSLGLEKRANRKVLKQIQKHGSPDEVLAWKRSANQQMKLGYRKPMFDAIGGQVGADSLSRKKQILAAHPYLRSRNTNLEAGIFATPASRLIEFGGRGEYGGQVKDVDTRRYANPLAAAAGYGGPVYTHTDKEGNPIARSMPFAHGQVIRSAYRKGKDIQRGVSRGGALARDVGHVITGKPRQRDAAGREKKREWEKPWFQNMAKSAATGAAILGGAAYLRKSPKARRKIGGWVKKGRNAVNRQVEDFFPDVNFSTPAAKILGRFEKPLRKGPLGKFMGPSAAQRAAARDRAALVDRLKAAAAGGNERAGDLVNRAKRHAAMKEAGVKAAERRQKDAIRGLKKSAAVAGGGAVLGGAAMKLHADQPEDRKVHQGARFRNALIGAAAGSMLGGSLGAGASGFRGARLGAVAGGLIGAVSNPRRKQVIEELPVASFERGDQLVNITQRTMRRMVPGYAIGAKEVKALKKGLSKRGTSMARDAAKGAIEMRRNSKLPLTPEQQAVRDAFFQTPASRLIEFGSMGLQKLYRKSAAIIRAGSQSVDREGKRAVISKWIKEVDPRLEWKRGATKNRWLKLPVTEKARYTPSSLKLGNDGMFFSTPASRLLHFDEYAANAGWDIRDPRGKSARVFAPGSRQRYRRPKEWHEKKENRDKLAAAAIVGAGVLGLAGGVKLGKKLAVKKPVPVATAGGGYSHGPAMGPRSAPKREAFRHSPADRPRW